MKLIKLHYDESKRPVWFNIDNICSIRQNYVDRNKGVLVVFKVDDDSGRTLLEEWHVTESVDEILQMVEPGHALIERIQQELK